MANDGTTGLEAALSKSFDLIILDLLLPGVGGMEICRRMRARPSYTPILMLTSRSSELDRVLGLEEARPSRLLFQHPAPYLNYMAYLLTIIL